MKQELIKYHEYLESDEEFTYMLRMNYEWNQERFEEMLSLVKEVMLAYKDEDVIPKSIVYFFTGNFDSIIGMSSNELFFKTIPDGYTENEYKQMVSVGHSELLRMRKRFYSGDFYGY